MTHANSTKLPGTRWEAEQLWNVSLLPVSTPREAQPAPCATVVELPLLRPRERRRNAA